MNARGRHATCVFSARDTRPPHTCKRNLRPEEKQPHTWTSFVQEKRPPASCAGNERVSDRFSAAATGEVSSRQRSVVIRPSPAAVERHAAAARLHSCSRCNRGSTSHCCTGFEEAASSRIGRQLRQRQDPLRVRSAHPLSIITACEFRRQLTERDHLANCIDGVRAVFSAMAKR